MIRDTVREWLEVHPKIAGYVFIGGVYLSDGIDVISNGAGGGYQGP